MLNGSVPGEHAAVLYLSGNAATDGPTTGAVAVTGIADVRCFGNAPEELAALLRTDGASTPGTTLFLSMGMRGAPDADVLAAVDTAGLETRNLRPALARLRVVKDEEELTRLRRAAELSALGAVEGMRSAGPGLGEADIQAVIEAEFQAGGAPGTSFPSIVASGSNALELHYNDNVSQLVDGELFGYEPGAYSGAVTRKAGRIERAHFELAMVFDRSRESGDAVRELGAGIGIGRIGGQMADAMARNEKLALEYECILISYIQPEGNYLEHEGLQRGVLWGIGRLARNRTLARKHQGYAD